MLKMPTANVLSKYVKSFTWPARPLVKALCPTNLKLPLPPWVNQINMQGMQALISSPLSPTLSFTLFPPHHFLMADPLMSVPPVSRSPGLQGCFCVCVWPAGVTRLTQEPHFGTVSFPKRRGAWQRVCFECCLREGEFAGQHPNSRERKISTSQINILFSILLFWIKSTKTDVQTSTTWA